MSLLQALVLGAVQGITEFLPISSSGHLVLFPFVVGWDEPSVAFDVAVHFGTLVAVAWVFRTDVVELGRALLGWASAPEADRRMLRMLGIATVPIAVFGLAAMATIEGTFERPVLVSLLLGITGWWLLTTESHAEPERGIQENRIDAADALLIGVAQAAAIFPGISRSGATIGAGMLRGLTRPAAARFAFVLSIPAIAGATVVKLPDLAREGAAGGAGAIIVGTIAAGLVAALAIRWFLGLVERRGLRPFALYCFAAMTAGLLTALARG